MASLSDITGSKPDINAMMQQKMATDEKKGTEVESRINEHMATPPALPKFDPPPTEQQSDPMQSWGTPAMWIATFGSLLTRQPLTAALKSGAAMMNAQKENDAASFKTAYDQWKAMNQNAMDRANYELGLYKEEGADLRTLSSQFKNDSLAQFQTMKMGEDYVKNMENAKAKMDPIIQKTELLDNHMLAWKEAHPDANPLQESEEQLRVWNDINKKGASSAPSTLSDTEYEDFRKDPKNIALADAYAKNPDPREYVRGTGKMAANKLDAIQRLAVERHPNLDIARAQLDFGERKRELGALAIRSAPAKIAVQEMDTLAQPMVTAIENLDPASYPDWNSVQNAYDKKTGGPDIVKAALAVQEFKTAFTNLMIRNGVPTDQARGKVDDLIDKNFSLDQIKAVVDQAKISGAAVIDALNVAKESALGGEKPKTELKEVKTQAEFDALPPNAEYMEDGQKYRKP